MRAALPLWPVYDLFNTKDGTQLFFGIIGDGQWKDFCLEFGKSEWLTDPRLQNNKDRSAARSWMLPIVTAMIEGRHIDELTPVFERLALPFAPVRKPGDLVDDPHLNASGGLLDVVLPNGKPAKVPALPIMFGASSVPHRRGEFLRLGPIHAVCSAPSISARLKFLNCFRATSLPTSQKVPTGDPKVRRRL